MFRKITIILISVSVILVCALQVEAQKRSSDILKEGLLGAGAGAVGGAASGAKGGDIWKGALAGAGVNVVGGALLDSISGEHVRNQGNVQQMPSQDAYGAGYNDGYNNGYKAGYAAAYKEGYNEGYKEGLKAGR